MRRLILLSGVLAAALMATPQSALTQQTDQPVGGGGGVQRDTGPAPGGTTGAAPGARQPDQPIGGGGGVQRDTGPAPGGTTPSTRPSDQPPGGGGAQQRPGPGEPQR
jgi:hypothetical protein